MPSPRLPEVEALVESLANDIAEASPAARAAWQVDGPATAGKSALLRLLADRLRARDLIPVIAGPPAQALDAGPLAVMEVAAGLKDAGVVNGQTSSLKDGQRPLAEKVAAVRDWVIEHNDAVILLYDEPAAWPDRSDQSGHFAQHARVVVHELVRDIDCRRVVTGDAPEAMRFADVHRIGSTSEPLVFLRDHNAWGPLAEAADSLAQIGEGQLGHVSPLQLRLLVAHVAITSADAVATQLLPRLVKSRRALSQRLLAELHHQPGLHDLLEAWLRLAHIRRPFTEELLRRTTGELGDHAENLLRRCLLYQAGEDYVLHETLRRDAYEFMRASERGGFRKELQYLAEYYSSVSAENTSEGRMLLASMEAFHYAARSGAIDLLPEAPFFVDQLDLLGKTLSYEFKRYDLAADVFEWAVSLDETDDYAQHYLGYNLDLLGRDAGRVEEHYRLAVELNGQHPWWRARLVTFLLTRGRTGDARLEWDAALDELTGADRDESVRLYETLHGWVAELLLRRGQLDFADDVLGDVPLSARSESPRLTALVRRLRALQLAEREGAFVPGPHLTPSWWTDGPFLLQRKLGEDGAVILRRWLAGRIEEISEETVELRVKEIVLGKEGEPKPAVLRIARDRFDALSRDWPSADLEPGRFVEVGLYSDEDGERIQRIIRVHPIRRWIDESLSAVRAEDDRFVTSEAAG